jgi:hypothetical protein
LGRARIVHPARLEELELIFDRGRDRQEEQSAIAILRIRRFAVAILKRPAKGDPDLQQSA